MEQAGKTKDLHQDYDLMDSVGWLMRSTLAVMRQEIERRMEPFGLTNAQWHPILKLYTGQADTVAELARGCMQDAGGMTRLLDRLEAKGLCRRKRCQTDRRVVRIELTPQGVEVASRIPVVLRDVHELGLQDFSAAEVGQLKSYLRRMQQTLQDKTGQA
ncbi:MarR family transcriptional regulator [Pseudomonas sp. S 311-6]|uniref:MarR family winged helix-turn-helix transcriptional regulator n=1 Tax=Kerstersia gyiorum TaxID=206506 RepID=UPI001070A05A|nr:MarR family transcriptional regulator [Kerstersia gyiorum]MCO7637733.1 MarR family transcriptional regulator [Pseudomonas sp. S 311-6]MCR4158668.1 MarR family transcriptional regulator [Kerstersia gyiorum]QBR41078.1 MarR family transcriptional regulator [Kerstersia gyiorum]